MKLLRIVVVLLLICSTLKSGAQNIPSWKVTKLADFISKSDSILVINFWATFCKPCIEEIPYFEKIVKKYSDKKVKFLMVSLDLKDEYPKGLTTFVKKNNYANQVIWLNETNADYFCPLVDKAWMGGIPSTLIVNKSTGYRKFFEQQLEAEQFETELKKAIESVKGLL